MRISYLIFLSFLFIILLFAATTYINFRQSEKVAANSEYVSHSTSIIRNSNRFQRNILNMVSGLRGFLLTGEDYFLQAYDTAASENANILRELKPMFPDTSSQFRLLADIDTLNNRWIAEFAAPLRQSKISAEASDKLIAAFNKLYREKTISVDERGLNRQLQDKLRAFINLEYNRRDYQKALLTASVNQTRMISITLTTLSIVLAFFIVTFLTYRLSRQLMKMVKMADSIAAGNYAVSTQAKGKDEVSRLARSLNHMARVLSGTISELKQKNQELDQFAHIVSHDMKAPLRGIDNVVTWIEEDHREELSPRLAEYMELIKGRIRRGENLIQGLLTYARIGKEVTRSEKVHVAELIAEVVENFPPADQGCVYHDQLPVLHTERLPLFQVLSNLISNALKYNDKPKPEVYLSAEDGPGYYVFSVRDNGPGIHANYHQKIFAIFQTLQEKDSLESTGVGLAIVKKILDARGETISIRSEPGQGACFSFTWKK